MSLLPLGEVAVGPTVAPPVHLPDLVASSDEIPHYFEVLLAELVIAMHQDDRGFHLPGSHGDMTVANAGVVSILKIAPLNAGGSLESLRKAGWGMYVQAARRALRSAENCAQSQNRYGQECRECVD